MMLNYLFGFMAFVLAPASIVWGWVAFFRGSKGWTLLPILSLGAFALGNISCIEAIVFSLRARALHVFWFVDRLENVIAGTGALACLLAIVLALCCVWKPTTLRWPALIAAFGVLPFWVVVGISA
jgi:hypothetical protein